MAVIQPIHPAAKVTRTHCSVEFSTAASGLSDSVNITGLKLFRLGLSG